MDFFTANETLNAADVLDVATMELLVRVEASGEDFYLAMADSVGNEDAAELLRRNGREEMGHARRIQRAIAIKTGHRARSRPGHRALQHQAVCPTPSTPRSSRRSPKVR